MRKVVVRLLTSGLLVSASVLAAEPQSEQSTPPSDTIGIRDGAGNPATRQFDVFVVCGSWSERATASHGKAVFTRQLDRTCAVAVAAAGEIWTPSQLTFDAGQFNISDSRAGELPSPGWYMWAGFTLCLVGGLLLMAIWRFGSIEHSVLGGRDPCFLSLGIATLVWAATYVLMLLNKGTNVDIVRTLFASINSAALLTGALLTDHFPWRKQIAARVRSYRNATLVFAAIVLFAVMFLAFAPPVNKGVHKIPELCLSFLVLTVLSVSFWESFRKRGYAALNGVVVAAIAITFAGQVAEVFHGRVELFFAAAPELRWLLLLMSKIMLVLLFLTLAFTWAHENTRSNSKRVTDDSAHAMLDATPTAIGPDSIPPAHPVEQFKQPAIPDEAESPQSAGPSDLVNSASLTVTVRKDNLNPEKPWLVEVVGPFHRRFFLSWDQAGVIAQVQRQARAGRRFFDYSEHKRTPNAWAQLISEVNTSLRIVSSEKKKAFITAAVREVDLTEADEQELIDNSNQVGDSPSEPDPAHQ